MEFEIFHDQGKGFMAPLEPTADDSVMLHLRAGRELLSQAWIQYSVDGSRWNEARMERGEPDDTGYYEFWEGVIPPGEERYHYRFRAEKVPELSGGAGRIVYYGAEGMADCEPVLSDCFSVIPGLSTPDWAKGIVWYSVMPDSFYNGDLLNDMAEVGLRKTVPWGRTLWGLREYYGGDIQGIIAKIDYIKELGAEAVYINPLWISDSQAGYGPNNYYETAPNYGNEEDFITLCEQLHANGLPVMIDAVFSYSQANSIFTNENGHQPLPGAFQSQDSAYSGMFRFEKWPVSYVHKWGGIENDLGSDRARDLLWRDEDAVLKRYLKPPYCADGWRFDAINSYAGTDTDLTKIGAEIRRETKGVKPDVLLVGEDFSKEMVLSGNWDAAQNSFFIFTALLWFQGGQYDQSWLVDRLNKMAKLPRQMGLCMYNNFENHDVKRILADYETEKYRFKGVWLLQMTFPGSPVIFYGAENGAGKVDNPSSRNSCNWNRGEWNYEVRFLCKALCELRKSYTALKDGVFKVGLVDNERQLTVYGRWDENGTVVTMLNQQACAQTVSLNLRQYHICDETVVTDYLTGQRYRVENGFAVVTIPAGGSILVTGQAGRYRGSWQLAGDIAVTTPEEACYVLDRHGCESEGMAANTPLFGCGYIEADITKEAAGGALVLGTASGMEKTAADKPSAGGQGIVGRVSVVFSEKSFAVYKGKDMLAGQAVLPEYGRVRLGIGTDGCVEVLINGEPAIDERIPMERAGQLYGGLALRGEHAVFCGVKAGQAGEPLYDRFEHGHLGSLLSTEKVRGRYRMAEGTLTVEAEELSLLLSEERSTDFTFQAELVEVKRGFAGIVSCGDDLNGVAFVRDSGNGDSLIFGYLKDGALIPCERVDGDFSQRIILKLQRIGTVYTAVYFQQGSVRGFASCLPANMSGAGAGLLCGAGAEAVFGYACFGDSIYDQASVNTPVTPENLCQTSDEVPAAFGGTLAAMSGASGWEARAAEGTAASKLEQYEIIGERSQWEYALGGIRRTVSEGLSQLMVTNRTYEDFKLQCTLLRTGGQGELGVTMLRSSVGEDLGDGYILSLNKEDQLSLTYRGKLLLEPVSVPVGKYGLKLNIIRRGETLYLYVGQKSEWRAVIPEITVKRGYLGFYFEDARGHVNNYLILDTVSRWLEPLSPWAQNIREEKGVLAVRSGEFVMANLKGAAYTHASVSVRILLDPVEAEKEAYAGILFGAAQDVRPKDGGVLAALDGRGTLFLSKRGERKAQVELGKQVSSAYLTVTADAGAYAVYLPGAQKPCLAWKDSSCDGGVISLVSENSRTGFYHFRIEDTTGRNKRGEKGNIGKETAGSAEIINTGDGRLADMGGYIISRNGIELERVSSYVETAPGDVVYRIEPFFQDGQTYVLELDITVHAPQSPECFPILYVRGNPARKIGLYSNGAYTCLINQNRAVIADEDAESTWVCARQRADETYHVRIESGPNDISVWINDSVIYRGQRLSDCLSGDFSNLPIAPEIVCIQGESGTARTELCNLELRLFLNS